MEKGGEERGGEGEGGCGRGAGHVATWLPVPVTTSLRYSPAPPRPRPTSLPSSPAHPQEGWRRRGGRRGAARAERRARQPTS
eukprot:3838458-Rhodomonas_salina.1